MFVDILLLIGGGTALGVSSFFMADSAAKITDVSNWDRNKDLREAHKWMTWAAVVGWVSVGLVILLIIIYVIFVFAVGSESSDWVVKGFLLLILAAMAVAGSLSALGASRMRLSSQFKEVRDNKAYENAIIAAVAALVGFVLVGALFLWKLLYKPKTLSDETDKEIEELQKQEVKTKEAELKAEEKEYKE